MCVNVCLYLNVSFYHIVPVVLYKGLKGRQQLLSWSFSLIKSLKPKKGTGHDNISTLFIHNNKHALIKPISILINKSMEIGTVPDACKIAKVVPIYKAKDKELFTNYRPISLLPSVSKLLEKIIHKRVYYFLMMQDTARYC